MIFKIFKYQIRFKDPIKIYSKTYSNRIGYILKATNHNMESSYGEIAPLCSFSKESLNDAYLQLIKVCNKLKKNIEIDEKKLYPSVLFGIKSALNFNNKELDCYHSGLLYHNCNFSTFQPKHKTYKVKLSNIAFNDAILIIKNLKQKYPNLKLRLDINQSWTYQSTIRFLENFQPTDFEYIEDPCKDLLDVQKLLSKTNFPIALDESLNDWTVSEIKRYENIKAIIIKPSLVNFTKYLPLQIPLVFSSSFESGIGILNIAFLAQKHSKKLPGLDTYRFLAEDTLKNKIMLNSNLNIKYPLKLNKSILQQCCVV